MEASAQSPVALKQPENLVEGKKNDIRLYEKRIENWRLYPKNELGLFICRKCGRSFNRMDNIVKHTKLHDLPNGNRRCPLCLTKSMTNSKEFEEHLASHRVFICPNCGKEKWVSEETGILGKALRLWKACNHCVNKFQLAETAEIEWSLDGAEDLEEKEPVVAVANSSRLFWDDLIVTGFKAPEDALEPAAQETISNQSLLQLYVAQIKNLEQHTAVIHQQRLEETQTLLQLTEILERSKIKLAMERIRVGSQQERKEHRKRTVKNKN